MKKINENKVSIQSQQERIKRKQLIHESKGGKKGRTEGNK